MNRLVGDKGFQFSLEDNFVGPMAGIFQCLNCGPVSVIVTNGVAVCPFDVHVLLVAATPFSRGGSVQRQSLCRLLVAGTQYRKAMENGQKNKQLKRWPGARDFEK